MLMAPSPHLQDTSYPTQKREKIDSRQRPALCSDHPCRSWVAWRNCHGRFRAHLTLSMEGTYAKVDPRT
jgi:hypothetical protein